MMKKRRKMGRKKFGRRRRKMRRRKKTGRRLRPSSRPYLSHIILNLTGRRKSYAKKRRRKRRKRKRKRKRKKKKKKIPTFLIPYGQFPPRKTSKTLNQGGTAAAHLLNVMDRLETKVSTVTF